MGVNKRTYYRVWPIAEFRNVKGNFLLCKYDWPTQLEPYKQISESSCKHGSRENVGGQIDSGVA